MTKTKQDVNFAKFTEILARLKPSWTKHANCQGLGHDLFFPERGGSTREAKLVCKDCVVRDNCYEHSLDLQHAEMFGIWGGTSARERRPLLQIRRLAAKALKEAQSA